MKLKKIGIYAAIISLALATLSGCNSNKDNTTDTNEVTVSPMNTDTPNESAIPPVATQDDTIVSDDDLDDDNDDLDDKVEDKLDDKLDKDDKYDAVFKDHLTTAEYKVEKDGTYEFECEPSDKKAYWNIYVLDEPFEDAFRYLANAYEPTIKATKESKKIKLKKGQYVYGVCSENSFTDEGTADNFKCPLTIELD